MRLNTLPNIVLYFFFNDTATTGIYTLSLHDALPISWRLLLLLQITEQLGHKVLTFCNMVKMRQLNIRCVILFHVVTLLRGI